MSWEVERDRSTHRNPKQTQGEQNPVRFKPMNPLTVR